MAPPAACILWPIRFDAASKIVRVTLGGTADDITLSVTVGRNYYVSGDDQADSSTDGGTGDLVAMLETALDTHVNNGGAFTVALDSDNFITVSHSSQTFQLLWAHANTTLDPTIFGFTAAAYPPTVPGSTTTAPDEVDGLWAPGHAYTEDSRDRQPYMISSGTTMSGLRRTSRLSTPKKRREVSWSLLDKAKILDEYVSATEPYGAFERAWSQALSLGRQFRLYDDETVRTSSSYQIYRMADYQDPLARSSQYKVRWDVRLPLVRADD